jgi:hypothetical protein
MSFAAKYVKGVGEKRGKCAGKGRKTKDRGKIGLKIAKKIQKGQQQKLKLKTVREQYRREEEETIIFFWGGMWFLDLCLFLYLAFSATPAVQ